mmetsp:Transcript_34794/g.109879  ORF Transcript_34794/g.109879 Transcript_34794/m.109879 type:complete len:181 (+) Transcript_34794:475-1017(+)
MRVTTLGDATYVPWEDIVPKLREAKLKSVEVKDLYAAMKDEEGDVLLVDVRPLADFEQLHAEDSYHVALFDVAEGNDSYTGLRKLTYKFIPAAGEPTDQRPEFVSEVKELAGDDWRICLMCGQGGTIASWPQKTGCRSRSLTAAYELLQSGFPASRILHLKGGFGAWAVEDLPCYTLLDN